ncbi:PIN-LIKES 7 isoform X1 [Olea europaea subsp. europaea]|uniref:PIN-LIKES 7 isoform X1 n=1 Tax=Olea europaea subsp. europaea TaxID=158383 RepID=A0A8S0R9K9_OLEEU|nr:PIN-LIKES 7 isoform X1 [Olea europaea subsp. europaea]
MGFWTLFEVASMPILQVLLISSLGAFMASDYLNLLPEVARRSLNKIVFIIFTPSLMFANLAKTVTLEDIISWWFMIVNVGITFLIGGILGWIAVKLLKPKPHLEGLIISMCASGNLGNIMLIIVPVICKQDGNPFGDNTVCSTVGLSYVSFSMALGGLYIWTYTYHLIRTSAAKYKQILPEEESSQEPNKDLEANERTYLINGTTEHDNETPIIEAQNEAQLWKQILGFLHQILEELLAPPTIAAIFGFIFGAVTWLRNLIIGDNAPLRVIEDTVELLGDGTIPCITLILGGNLTQGTTKTATFAKS